VCSESSSGPTQSLREQVAAARVTAALDAIEEARCLLVQAAEALSPVERYTNGWQRTVQMSYEVQGLWGALAAWRAHIAVSRLNNEPNAAEIARWLGPTRK
jgi:hypothetical protein